jgi:diketogulonate reductase-like aldo/keto reductase
MERDAVRSAVTSAVRAGYRRIDCAAVYFNEDAVGDALESVIKGGTVKREDLYVVSKLASPLHHSPELGIRKTLTDLKLDYLDLYLGK